MHGPLRRAECLTSQTTSCAGRETARAPAPEGPTTDDRPSALVTRPPARTISSASEPSRP